jgi:serine dehydrogenase proteinase
MAEQFPRGTALPSQSPLFWAQQKDRYLRQLLIGDIEERTKRRLVVYFANRLENAQIDATDPAYFAEMLGDTGGAPVDLLLETVGGLTDAAEHVVSVLEKMAPDLRLVVAGSAKSNGTVLCFAGQCILLGTLSELGPIEPQIITAPNNFIPATILADPTFANQNLVLHQFAKFVIEQTRKLATRLLKNGMKKGVDDADIEQLVNKLLTRQTYYSHGSVIDHIEAKALGLTVQYLPPEDELWQAFHLLRCIYEADCRKNRYLKIFEGRRLSSAIQAPMPAPAGTS